MIAAAGVLILAPENMALFLLRGPGSDHPLEWAFAGGQLEPGETAAQGAARECEEETGFQVEPDELIAHTRGIAPAQLVTGINEPEAGTPVIPSEDVDFTAFVHRVDAQFTPAQCDEHIGYCWAPIDHPPQPLHPGCMVALQRFGMDELGVARAMAAGQLVSPQRYHNVTLFALRITGTGASYRKGVNEYVWREPAEYLNDEFLARCNGLPVIWIHPPKATLDSKEFAKRIVGTIFLPYLKGDEPWGIAKIYDDEAVAEMCAAEEISTSPTVVLNPEGDNVRAELEDGSTVLIEGKPILLDHLAICSKGVWDKGGPSSGVDRTAAEPAMAMADAEPEPDFSALRLLGARANALSIRLTNHARRA